jgi:hypothetical protein
MENKPNFKNAEMIVTITPKRDYRNDSLPKCPKKQTQNKPKQTQFRQTRRSLGEGGQTQNTCRVEALAKTETQFSQPFQPMRKSVKISLFD